jgi:hypothetical protein
VLTDEQQRNGLIKTTSRWPNKEVPFDINNVFSEYCSTKLQIAIGAWREISVHYDNASAQLNPGG